MTYALSAKDLTHFTRYYVKGTHLDMETGSTPVSSMIDTRQILYHKKNLI